MEGKTMKEVWDAAIARERAALPEEMRASWDERVARFALEYAGWMAKHEQANPDFLFPAVWELWAPTATGG